ncbi:hypothetical protein N474_17170 [Pseudoalteromonas luteoviolacea CPMOR-2]|nr:hypothetical protein N474_17170 [Pseudoalteromonas luteoviolacea CPMOR-2]
MNGRIYDADTGRFMQTDPFVQAPSNLQNYNAFSYVLNNPLSYTDPSGYFFKPLKKLSRNIIRAHAKVFGAEVTNIMGNVGSLACLVWAPVCAAAWNYEFTRAMGGSSSQAFKAGLTAAATAVVGQNIGFQSYSAQFVFDGVVGGIMADVNGGNFGHAFWAAGLNTLLGGGGNYTQNPITNVVISAAVGGTISEVTGGKFRNGAYSAAFTSAMRQDWSSNPGFEWDGVYEVGSPEWDAREAAMAEMESQEAQNMSFSGKDMYAAHWLPTPPKSMVDFSAGFGDLLSFGGTQLIREYMGTNGTVNMDSIYYSSGQVAGVIHSTVLGGAIGWRAAGSAGKGLEFSHWIPNRMGGPRSLWNGNFVTTEFHALSDPYRYRFMKRTWKALNPMPSRLSQQWNRIPYVYKGGAAGLGYGAASGVNN